MDLAFTQHALDMMVRWGFEKEQVLDVVERPRQIVPAHSGCTAYQSQVGYRGRSILLRVILNQTVSPARVVTVYRTSKIRKFWMTS